MNKRVLWGLVEKERLRTKFEVFCPICDERMTHHPEHWRKEHVQACKKRELFEETNMLDTLS